jgi:hypothetical protein
MVLLPRGTFQHKFHRQHRHLFRSSMLCAQTTYQYPHFNPTTKSFKKHGRRKASRVVKEGHESEIHVQLLMAVK